MGELSSTTKLRGLELVMDTRMLEGTSIREHVFKMVTYFKVLEVLGSDIDGETQVDIFLHCCLHHSLNLKGFLK